MKIEKLPSGSYRIRKMYKGQTYTVVTDYKPTQKEAIQLLAAEMDKTQGNSSKERLTFKSAAIKYMEDKNHVLSPSTMRGYNSILRNLPDIFTALPLSDITSITVQQTVNRYSADHSPKSTRNAHGFIVAVLGMFRPDLQINTTLPQKIRNEPYIPSDEDIRRILEYSKGTMYEAAIILATFGLRRSEICALTTDDINGNIATINKAMVQDSAKNWIIKTTKTEAGTREIYLPDYVVTLIRNQGYVYNGYPNSIVCYLQRVQKKLGMPRFSLHKLRHYYASMSHALGIPDSYIMASGGWKSDSTLKQVYRHAMDDKKDAMQKKAAEYINKQILS